MAHYAILNDDNEVCGVFVGVDENSDLPEGYSSWEEWYTNRKGQTVKRTSYNTFENTHLLGETAFRGNYAGGIGNIYDPVNDIFLPEKEWDSWTLDVANAKWVAPIALPETNPEQYIWNEEAYQADNTTGWVLMPEYR